MPEVGLAANARQSSPQNGIELGGVKKSNQVGFNIQLIFLWQFQSWCISRIFTAVASMRRLARVKIFPSLAGFSFSLVRVSIHLGASIRTLMNLKGSVHFG